MRIKMVATATLAALIAMTGVSVADVTVNFVNPERFADRDFRSSSKRSGILGEFERYFDRLGARHLKDGQAVRIDVLDVRLAGRYEPWHRQFNDVRVLRDTTPPRFKIRYTLTQGGRVIATGEESVSDMSYLWRSPAGRSSDRFAYEKDMLNRWFRDRFVSMRPPRA